MSDLKARIQPTSNTLLSVDWLLSIAYTDSSDLHHACAPDADRSYQRPVNKGGTKQIQTAEIGL